jgi:hypothetical protein
MNKRRFPPPWTIEEVKEASRQIDREVIPITCETCCRSHEVMTMGATLRLPMLVTPQEGQQMQVAPERVAPSLWSGATPFAVRQVGLGGGSSPNHTAQPEVSSKLSPAPVRVAY